MGWDVVSVDLKPSEDNSPDHITGDLFRYLETVSPYEFDLAVFHPDCTYLTCSGLHWNKRVPGRQEKTEKALEDVERLFEWVRGNVSHGALENPQGCIGTRLEPSKWGFKVQYVQPYEFGDDASKKTGLWKMGLPDLVPTKYIQPRMVDGKPRWGNQTDSGQNKLGPSEKRAADRAKTYEGLAKAIVDQWGDYVRDSKFLTN